MSIPEGRNFGPDDDLLVQWVGGGAVRFTTRGHDQEELSPEDVRKLISFLQDLVGDPAVLTPDHLDAMRPGEPVHDADGDVWTKQEDGLWQWWGDISRPAHHLVEHHSPIRSVYAHPDTPTPPNEETP